MSYDKDEFPEITRFVEGKKYTNAQLNHLADIVLREQASSPEGCTCPPPGHRDEPCKCLGPKRGIGGDDPILFKEHEDQRRRREIFTTNGTPDAALVQGIYNRSHPQGRKINSDDQRKRNGASYYK